MSVPVSTLASVGPCPVMCGEDRRADRHQRDEHDDHHRGDGHPVGAEAREHQLQRGSALDALDRRFLGEAASARDCWTVDRLMSTPPLEIPRPHAGSWPCRLASFSPSATGKWHAVRCVAGSPSRCFEQRLLDGAHWLRLGAPSVEATARRRVDRRRHVAGEDDPVARCAPCRDRPPPMRTAARWCTDAGRARRDP